MSITLTGIPVAIIKPGQKLPWDTTGTTPPSSETDETLNIFISDDNINQIKGALSGQATADYSAQGIANGAASVQVIEEALALKFNAK